MIADHNGDDLTNTYWGRVSGLPRFLKTKHLTCDALFQIDNAILYIVEDDGGALQISGDGNKIVEGKEPLQCEQGPSLERVAGTGFHWG